MCGRVSLNVAPLSLIVRSSIAICSTISRDSGAVAVRLLTASPSYGGFVTVECHCAAVPYP